MTDIEKKFYDRYDGEYKLISEYIGVEDPVVLKHDCGNTYQVIPHNFFRQNNSGRCPFCYSSKNMTKDQFQWKLDKVYDHTIGDGYISLEFNGMNKKGKLKHKCGHIWETRGSVIQRGSGCPNCNHPNTKLLTEDVKKEIFDLTNGEYIVLSDYIGTDINIDIKHIKCDHVFHTTRKNFVNRMTRCPKCVRLRTSSKGERIIRYYLDKHNIEYEEEKTFKSCFNERVLPFDFYIETVNLVIEFDGEQHFYPRRDDDESILLKKVMLTDSIKNKCIPDLNLTLIRIPYNISFREISKIVKEISINIKENKEKVISSTTIEKYNLYISDNINTYENYYTNIKENYFE